MEKFVNAHHRRLVGWSEIREGGLAANATVMDWVGGATEAAIAGHDVVMSPLADCYFDHYQSLDHSNEPHAIGGYLPLPQVYDFEPMPTNLPAAIINSTSSARKPMSGPNTCPTSNTCEYMVFPRLGALAEVVWSPKTSRNWDDFLRRVRVDGLRLDQLGVNHRALSTKAVEPLADPPQK